MPPQYQSATPNPALRDRKQQGLQSSAWHREQTYHKIRSATSSAPRPSSLARTTLSQRFRRAIQQGDLPAAQRISARAFELQFLPGPAIQHNTYPSSDDQTSPYSPPKAALRAAETQRPSSAHPFDVRNVEPISERINHTKHHHHRKYTLAIHDEPLNDSSSSSADPSLIIAIKSNADVELVRWLIEMGHEQKGPSVDADGNTVLHLATLYDRSDIIYAYSTYTNSHVAATLADLIDAETLHDHRTALHLACIRGYDDVARQLLDLGAHVDLQDRAGNTALHFASAWGHVSLVQLLIERGCSLAVKNVERSTALDYAYSHSVKEALETMGRLRYESRKKSRRVPVATVMPSATRATAANAVTSQFDDSTLSDKQGRTRPFPSFLNRNASNGGGSRSTATTPVRMTFADTSADQTTEVINDWDPEKTFAQPGQNLFPGSRAAFSSPPVQRVASPANFSTSGQPSIDLYSEILNQSPRTSTSSSTAPTSQPETSSQPRQMAHSPPSMLCSPDESKLQGQSYRGLLPQSNSEAEMRRQLSPNFGGLGRTIGRAPSPGHMGATADKVRVQDAAAMSLFRSTTPQPSHVPGRIETPPLIQQGSESPFMLAKRVKSPPTERSALRATSGSSSGENSGSNAGSGDGPPLLAPVATFPRPSQGGEGEGNQQHRGNSPVEEMRSRYNQMDLTNSSGRRDSSPSTPRPDDRETFA
ncbi:related to HOS4-subunit of the Set3 complex [Ustilago bromivora]|uniref:Related to HOS4 - subunit of the Set3 complex n=1 Tax=Ustilago bromivora TaxID=307758 RepID=A0A1K0G9H7_9BASI|nr:related to HOS4-subunit of the Set3 complex [Ustilago bromivora]SYW75965.1 related to HOS4 - subunit of the Set3 complex [Ustilago bromivora]